MLTYSGRVVDESAGVPSLLDIAVHLGRIPRFVGATNMWWPVLAHSGFVGGMSRMIGLDPKTQLYALLHDAHESMTGDVPTPVKCDCLRAFQASIDQRIFAEYMGFQPTEHMRAEVKRLDTYALMSEACRFTAGASDFEKIPEFESALDGCILLFSGPGSTIYPQSPGVMSFIGLVEELMYRINE